MLLRLLLLVGIAFALPLAGAAEWKPLWDGQTLAGWRTIGKGEWRVEAGAIKGTHVATEPEYSHLVSEGVYSDLEVRFQFRSVAGNSGFYFRIEEDPKAFSGVRGFQAEIDPAVNVGGLYETNGRSWVVQPSAEQVARYFKPGEWNTMSISAIGPKIVVKVNDHVSASIDDPQGRTSGRFALQVHGGQQCEVYFKDLEIRVLKDE